MSVKKYNHILLCGASSVGKTTLANDWCLKHKEYQHIQEIARDIMTRDGITRENLETSLKGDKKVFLDLQHSIIKEQNIREIEFESQPFISDRGPDPLVYVQCYVGQSELDHLSRCEATQACFNRYRRCLVVVLTPLSVSTDDGFRLVQDGKEQELFTNTLTSLLDKYRIPYIYMEETNREKRLECLEKATQGLFPFNSEIIKGHPLCLPLFSVSRSSSHIISLPTIDITQDTIKLTFSPFEIGKTNRMIDRYGLEQFLLINFNAKVTAELVRNILNKGVWVNGEEYQFLGCSSGGLKQRKCYMFKGTVETVEAILKECGSFSSINSVSKQLKRIGQLFSAAVPTGIEIPDEKLLIKDDIETRAGNFTDGCGAIGTGFAERIVEGAKLEVEPDYIPSVFQIRYEGCKGIVAKDPGLEDDVMMVRKSMKKFNVGSKPFRSLWLCDYSKPYTYGYLNKQFIVLFSALGIKDEVFLKKQDEYFKQVERMKEDPEVAIQMLGRSKRPTMAISIINCASDIHKADIQKELGNLQSKAIDKMEKLRIIIPESRNIFGVCDSLGVLDYGECFIRPTIHGKPKTLSGLVTVSKNPCYLLGDVRVLKAVADDRVKGLEHLIDCIVFPTRGKRPHPAEIAGSDLDGDMYFVCWDQDLIMPHLVEPYDYPSTEAPLTTKNVTRSMKIDYLSTQDKQSRVMGKIDKYFNYWADIKGAGCEECISLGKLFARSVDASKTGDVVFIPPKLKPPDQVSRIESMEPVWKKMENKAKETKCVLQEKVASDMLLTDEFPVVSEAFVWSLIKEDPLNLSEFQLFQFVQRWCLSQSWSDEEIALKLEEFSTHINFGKLSIVEQITVIDAGIPKKYVTNALNKSNLLSSEMLRCFSLHSSHHEWRKYIHSYSSDFKWEYMLRALERHDESLIIFCLPESVTIGLHFLVPLQAGVSDLNDGSVIAYFFSSHFGYQQRHVLGKDYNLHLNDELLQIYRDRDKRKTFLWLKSEIEPKQQGRHKSRDKRTLQDADDSILFDKLSVDLTTFKGDITRGHRHPLVNKTGFKEIEIFVKRASHKPAYFDIHIADQPDCLFPEVTVSTEDIEEVPDDDSICIEKDGDAIQALLSAGDLQGLAEKGQCYHFLELVSSQQCNDIVQIQQSLLTLLKTLHIKHSPKHLEKEMETCIQNIVTSLYHMFESPAMSLQLLEKLSWLNSTAVMEQVVPLILANVQVPDFSCYIQALSLWKFWYALSLPLAHQLACKLSILCQSLLDASDDKLNASSDPPLFQLASNVSVESAPQALQVKRYLSYFAHRVLLYFLAEVSCESNPRQDHHNRLFKMKAYTQSDDQLGTSFEHGSNKDETSKEFKIGFQRTEDINSAEFSIGTYVVITPMFKVQSSFPVALGCITHISKHPANITVAVEEPVPLCLKRSATLCKGHWELGLLGNVTIFNRSMKVLSLLADSKTQSTSLLSLLVHSDGFPPLVTLDSMQINTVHTLKQDVITCSREISLDTSFNEVQKMAVVAGLNQRLTLVHGPPGTGKTHVACAIVSHCVKQSQKVLVVAETNMAVDNLTRRLLELGIRILRIGNLLQISPDVRHASIDHQIEMKRLQTGKDKSRSPFPNPKLAKEIIELAEVVATTCAGAGDPLLKSFSFSFVLIDEATQVTEPVSLIPIVLKSQQLVLIGDPQQLSPTIPLMKHTTPRDSEEGIEVNDLSLTLFHRFYQVLPSIFLEEQHRMHPSLALFPSKHFYGGKLKSAAVLNERQPLHIPWINKDKPSVFINASSNEKRVGTSFCNIKEAKMVVQVVKSLLNNEVSPLEIVVLTPYIGQVHSVREELSPLTTKVEISTIDRFQGREKDIVLFSTVRCNPNASLGFTDDLYRMNVLLTRAKRSLIGIGSKETLENGSQLWSEWLKDTAILTEDEFNTYAVHNADGKKQSSETNAHTSKRKKRPSPHTAEHSQGTHHSRSTWRAGHQEVEVRILPRRPDQRRNRSDGAQSSQRPKTRSHEQY